MRLVVRLFFVLCGWVALGLPRPTVLLGAVLFFGLLWDGWSVFLSHVLCCGYVGWDEDGWIHCKLMLFGMVFFSSLKKPTVIKIFDLLDLRRNCFVLAKNS